MKSRLALPFLLAFGFACVSNAQVNARLTGSVVDPSGLAVPGATVDVFLPGGAKPVLSMSTTAEGLFAFSAVLPGHYDVIVTAAGFRKSANRDVILSTGETGQYHWGSTRKTALIGWEAARTLGE